MRILNRLPYGVEPITLELPGRSQVRVKPYQIVTWVSLGLPEVLQWDARVPAFLAILDPGNNHNFSIGQRQLTEWAGIRPQLLPRQGTVRERGERIALHGATLWLHANQAGTRELRRDQEPYRLRVADGIAIYPDARAPRLPVLGLRAITRNDLQLLIDSERLCVWLRTPDWRAKLVRFLS